MLAGRGCGPRGGSLVHRWGYTSFPVDSETELTEPWELLPGGDTTFEERFGADAPAQIANRVDAAHNGISATLVAIEETAEAQ